MTNNPVRFARRLFRIAGIYGLAVLIPQYFLEGRIGRDEPPAITHPEFFYGFIGVAVAWQVAFLVIAHDPRRHRALIVPAILEKASFGAAAIALFSLKRISVTVMGFAAIDLILGVLFALTYLHLPADADPESTQVA